MVTTDHNYKSHWTRQVYFYLIMFICVAVVSIGVYRLAIVNLSHFWPGYDDIVYTNFERPGLDAKAYEMNKYIRDSVDAILAILIALVVAFVHQQALKLNIIKK
jgi:hypothetical protein